MSNESSEELARMAEEARQVAQQAADRATLNAKARAEQIEADVRSGEMGDEFVKQLGLIYGGLIAIALVMIQPFLSAGALDTSATICVIAFSVAVPFLAALVMVNRLEVFRRRRTPSVMVTITQVVAQGAALVGITAGFWHITWVAGVTFLVASLVAMGVHSAGFMRLEFGRKAETGFPGSGGL